MLFFFNDTATTEIYPLSLHDALPIWRESTSVRFGEGQAGASGAGANPAATAPSIATARSGLPPVARSPRPPLPHPLPPPPPCSTHPASPPRPPALLPPSLPPPPPPPVPHRP